MSNSEHQTDAEPSEMLNMTKLYHHMEQVACELETTVITLEETVAAQFQKLAKGDRGMLRRVLSQDPESGKRSFSFTVISYRMHNECMDLGWSKLVLPKGGGTRLPQRLPQSKKLVHLARIKADADPDEFELLECHEHMSRLIRRMSQLGREAETAMEAFWSCHTQLVKWDAVRVRLASGGSSKLDGEAR